MRRRDDGVRPMARSHGGQGAGRRCRMIRWIVLILRPAAGALEAGRAADASAARPQFDVGRWILAAILGNGVRPRLREWAPRLSVPRRFGYYALSSGIAR